MAFTATGGGRILTLMTLAFNPYFGIDTSTCYRSGQDSEYKSPI